MLKKVFSFREQLLHFTDVFRFNLRFDEVPKSALFIQINQDLQTGSGKGVNRNRITIREIDTDRGFNLSARSFEFGDFDFGPIQFGGCYRASYYSFSAGYFAHKMVGKFSVNASNILARSPSIVNGLDECFNLLVGELW